MAKNFQLSNNEINFIRLIQTAWEGKWKIAVAIVISITAMTSYQSTKSKNFIIFITWKLIKEAFYFMLNNLIVWFFEVIAEIGRFIKNMWKLNFVIKRKD